MKSYVESMGHAYSKIVGNLDYVDGLIRTEKDTSVKLELIGKFLSLAQMLCNIHSTEMQIEVAKEQVEMARLGQDRSNLLRGLQ